MTAAAFPLYTRSLTSFPCFRFGSFFDLRRALLSVLEFFSQQCFFFIRLRECCFGFCDSIFCVSGFALFLRSGCSTRWGAHLGRHGRARRHGVRAKRFHFLAVEESEKRREQKKNHGQPAQAPGG